MKHRPEFGSESIGAAESLQCGLGRRSAVDTARSSSVGNYGSYRDALANALRLQLRWVRRGIAGGHGKRRACRSIGARRPSALLGSGRRSRRRGFASRLGPRGHERIGERMRADLYLGSERDRRPRAPALTLQPHGLLVKVAANAPTHYAAPIQYRRSPTSSGRVQYLLLHDLRGPTATRWATGADGQSRQYAPTYSSANHASHIVLLPAGPACSYAAKQLHERTSTSSARSLVPGLLLLLWRSARQAEQFSPLETSLPRNPN